MLHWRSARNACDAPPADGSSDSAALLARADEVIE
jgi:hypothetical protein